MAEDPKLTALQALLRPTALEQLKTEALARTGQISDFLSSGYLAPLLPQLYLGHKLRESLIGTDPASYFAQKFQQEQQNLPPALTTGEKVARGVGNVLPDVALMTATGGLTGIGEGLVGETAGATSKFLAGQALHSAAYAPIEYGTRDPLTATINTVGGPLLALGIGKAFTGLGRVLGITERKTVESIAKNLLEDNPLVEGLAKEGQIIKDLDPNNLNALEVLNTTAPPQEWLPEISKHVANGDPEPLIQRGLQLRRANLTAEQLAEKEANSGMAEIYTADGSISSKQLVADKTTKQFLDMGIQPSSILDEIRPSATLAERKYILLNGDEESFREVMGRLKVPARKTEQLIEVAKTTTDKGQSLFNSLTDWAKIARERGDVDVFQVPKTSQNYEKYRALKFTQDELNGPFLTMDEAAREASQATITVKTPAEQALAKSFETDLIKAQRIQTLDSIKGMIERGDTETADLLLDKHVKVGKLLSIAEKAKNDLASMGEEDSVFGQILRQYGKNTAEAQAKLHGTFEPVPGVGLHFPEWNSLSGLRKSKVLVSVKDVNKEESLHQLLLHEYGHDVDEFLTSAARLGDDRAKAVLGALREAGLVHDHRMWDPIAEGVADLNPRQVKWPKNINERVDVPPNYAPQHHLQPKESSADILALLATPRGRESLNPEVREIIEPFFGKIKEEYIPKYGTPIAEHAGSGTLIKPKYRAQTRGFTPKINTVKTAGKVLTTPAEESVIHLGTLNSATNPNTGTVPSGATNLISQLGPIASAATGDILEGAGPFYKGPMLENLGQASEKVTLKDYFMAIKTIRASTSVAGVATNIANILSNTYKAITQAGETTGAVVGDIAKVAVGLQKERQVFFGEALAQISAQADTAFGMHSALPAGLRQFANEIRQTREFINHPDYVGKLAAAIPNKALSKVGGVIAKGIEKPFQALSSVDTYYFDVNFAGSIHKQAYAKSIAEGKTAIQALEEVANQVKGFEKEGLAIQAEARQAAGAVEEFDVKGAKNYAKQYTLQNASVDIQEAKLAAERSIFVAREGKKLDKFLDMLDRWDNESYGAVSVPLLFRRTPAYIIREGLRTSPFGFLPIIAQSLGKGGKEFLNSRESSLLIGQAIFGTAAFYGIWSNIQNGNIKAEPGGFNPNKAQRDTYRAAGNNPGSLHIKMFGKTRIIPLDRIQPIGGSIVAMLDYKKEHDDAKANGVPTDIIHNSGASLAWNLTKELGVGDFARNLGDMIDAINSNEEVGNTTVAKRYLAQLGASFVPAAIRQTRLGLGKPYVRPEETGILGAPYAGLKAAFGEGEKVVGLFGETKRHSIGGPVGVLTGGAVGNKVNDPIVNTMIKVGAYHAAPNVSPEVEKRSKKEQVAFQIGKGKLQKDFVSRIVLNPGFASLAPEAQKRLIDKAFTNASELADRRAKALLKLKGIINENAIWRGNI